MGIHNMFSYIKSDIVTFTPILGIGRSGRRVRGRSEDPGGGTHLHVRGVTALRRRADGGRSVARVAVGRAAGARPRTLATAVHVA